MRRGDHWDCCCLFCAFFRGRSICLTVFMFANNSLSSASNIANPRTGIFAMWISLWTVPLSLLTGTLAWWIISNGGPIVPTTGMKMASRSYVLRSSITKDLFIRLWRGPLREVMLPPSLMAMTRTSVTISLVLMAYDRLAINAAVGYII